MKKVLSFLLFASFVVLPLQAVFADAGYNEAKKNLTEKRIPYWQEQLEKKTGGKVEIAVNLDTYPKTEKALKNLDFDVLSRIRGSFNAATSSSANKDHLKGKVTKVVVKNDEKLEKSKFDYDSGSKTLTVVTTPKEKWWIDGDRLVAYLGGI